MNFINLTDTSIRLYAESDCRMICGRLEIENGAQPTHEFPPAGIPARVSGRPSHVSGAHRQPFPLRSGKTRDILCRPLWPAPRRRGLTTAVRICFCPAIRCMTGTGILSATSALPEFNGENDG